MIELSEHARVGDIVASDYRAAAVFQRFGIDFCCGGRQSIADACRAGGLDQGDVFAGLKLLQREDASADAVTDWPVARLVAHILETHHAYIREAAPVISAYLEKLVSVHATRHPELRIIHGGFLQISRDLEPHMRKEEQILFPYILELQRLAEAKAGQPHSSPFGGVENPIRMMEKEHEDAGRDMLHLRELTSGFTPPDDGCTTYRVCFSELLRFETDLHRHVHLENNVLFPRALALETQVCGN